MHASQHSVCSHGSLAQACSKGCRVTEEQRIEQRTEGLTPTESDGDTEVRESGVSGPSPSNLQPPAGIRHIERIRHI
eukprot:500277-Rhodomonas_salina.1